MYSLPRFIYAFSGSPRLSNDDAAPKRAGGEERFERDTYKCAGGGDPPRTEATPSGENDLERQFLY